jgi:hypothetical protein
MRRRHLAMTDEELGECYVSLGPGDSLDPKDLAHVGAMVRLLRRFIALNQGVEPDEEMCSRGWDEVYLGCRFS